jgi:2Fe-2S ferredoxin
MLKIKFIQHNGEERIVETYAVCGGSCICGTCQVYVVDGYGAVGPPGEDELVVLGETGVQKPTSRLSCQIRLSESCDGMTFTVAPPRKD